MLGCSGVSVLNGRPSHNHFGKQQMPGCVICSIEDRFLNGLKTEQSSSPGFDSSTGINPDFDNDE
jgi:hypothetical protein